MPWGLTTPLPAPGLIAAVLAAAKLLETGELEERLGALEAAVRGGQRAAPEVLFPAGEP